MRSAHRDVAPLLKDRALSLAFLVKGARDVVVHPLVRHRLYPLLLGWDQTRTHTRAHLKNFEHFFPRNSVVFFDRKGPPEELLRFGVQEPFLVVEGHAQDVFEQVSLVSALPGYVLEDHFEKDDPQGPDIALCGVWFASKDLRRHVKRGAHAGAEQLIAEIVDVFGEPEVCDFEGPVM